MLQSIIDTPARHLTVESNVDTIILTAWTGGQEPRKLHMAAHEARRLVTALIVIAENQENLRASSRNQRQLAEES